MPAARRANSERTLPDLLSALPPAALRLLIDREALAANWHALDRLSGDAETGAAVKADGYGLGAGIVVPALAKAGARSFFVAHWQEVPAVLDAAPGASVSVLHGVADAAEAAFARASGAVPVINSLHQANVWVESGGGPCHLMVDSGMNRLGLEPAHVGDPLIARLEIEVLMSHLASADEDSALNARQLYTFREVAAQFPDTRRSLANSAGIALGPDFRLDLTRPGLALYGGIPRPALAGTIRQVAYPEAAVLQVRALSAGESVGYNATFTAERAMRVATVACGYADGILRCWGREGALFHGDAALPIVGRVSMDMTIVDCTGHDVREGDFLTIPYDLPHAAELTGLSQYELLTVLGSRFSRQPKTR
ncbi:alanine racemase [Aurantiacibacter spongiae]|uniref:alanine racemase n=1 Tax=Aurantiacibacter spongiae TaxID=2488860 RepID=UPI001F441A84|nr:alanine racemase [Aurantiacibacter spongiae]